jgi:hypothetical protein
MLLNNIIGQTTMVAEKSVNEKVNKTNHTAMGEILCDCKSVAVIFVTKLWWVCQPCYELKKGLLQAD